MNEPNPQTEFEPHRYLSAPWRMQYLNKNPSTSGCIFCEKLMSDDDVRNLVVWRSTAVAAVMNLYPYSTGHLMLMPYQHVASPEELVAPEIMHDLAQEIPATMRALRRVLGCQGFNTGMNTGAVAGAGIADHMHMHIVPRWGGDANFMPIVANVTVFPELLSVTYAKLRAESIVEHDPERQLRALVFSPTRTSVLLLDNGSGSLPVTVSDRNQALVATMGASLAAMGLESSVIGWAGDDTVVWQASEYGNPSGAHWTKRIDLSESLVSLVDDALAHLADSPN